MRGHHVTPRQCDTRDGIVIWETPADARAPFLLKFNINTQLRYLNTQDTDVDFTDHLGVIRGVHERNDIPVNRAMFIWAATFSTRGRDTGFTVWNVRRCRFDHRRQQHRVAIQQGPRDHRGLHWRPRQPIAGEHVPISTATDRSMAGARERVRGVRGQSPSEYGTRRTAWERGTPRLRTLAVRGVRTESSGRR